MILTILTIWIVCGLLDIALAAAKYEMPTFNYALLFLLAGPGGLAYGLYHVASVCMGFYDLVGPKEWEWRNLMKWGPW